MKSNKTEIKNSVMNQIKQLIFSGQIKCGEKLSEQKLADQLNVSRTPVREAILLLHNEGIIDLQSNKTAVVTTFDHDSLADLALMRINLECMAVKLAVRNGSNQQFSDLRDFAGECLNAAMKKDFSSRVEADADFHLMLTEIGKSELLYQMQRNLRCRVQLWQTVYLPDAISDLFGIEHHFYIADKLLERDLDSVLRLSQSHLYHTYASGLSESNKKLLLSVLGIEDIPTFETLMNEMGIKNLHQ